jgi:CRP-like cAMP-binding protein
LPDALARVLAALDAEQLITPDLFRRVSFAAGERFIAQGEPDTTVYVITTGSVRVACHSDGHTEELASLEAPTIVGELAAFFQGRTTDVTAQSTVEAVALDAVTIRDLCRNDPELARSVNDLVWRRAPVATVDSNLRAEAWTAPAEQERLVTAIRELARQRPELFEQVSVTPDPFEPFIREGDKLERVYLILAGEANVKLPDGRAITLGPGSPLGEIAALSPRGLATATVRFTRQSDLLSLSRDEFRALRKDADALVTERLNQTFTRALPSSVNEMFRSVRDQNIEALILRASLDMVLGAAGIYQDLNPAATTASPHAGWAVIRQKASLTRAVASLWRARTRGDIAAIVTGIRGIGLEGTAALKMINGEAALIREDWLERVAAICKPHLPEGVATGEFDAVRRRFELLRWLDEVLMADGALDATRLPGATADEKLRNFLKKQESTEGSSILDALDDLFETLMAAGLTRGSKPMVEDLRVVQFQKIRAHAKGATAVELPADHPARAGLRELRRRLARGEESAIGGADYATQRFPRLLLDRIVQGAVKIVAFDGTPAAGSAFVVDRFGPGARDPGVQPQYMTTEVQGLDGSGGRTLVTFHTDGTQVLLLTGFGVSRQRHNAAAILLYERNGRRIPEDHLILAAEGLSYVDAMRLDIQRALEEEASRAMVLGERVDHGALWTGLLILQHPREFEAGLKKAGSELRYASAALVDFYIGYARLAGGMARYIIPKVGGRGLYGDTAGAFVRACFTAGIRNLSRDVVFNGTAGGLLADLKPGESLLCPSGSIAGYEGEGRFSEFPIEGRISGALAERLRDRVTVTSTHVSVGAPGEETYDLIRDFVARGFESIDVEGAAIAEAVAEAGGRLTPIYTFSDNPLHSEHDRFDSLAVMGPFFEGSRFNAALWDVLWDVLVDCQRP